jgi:DNA-binding XRE family transcriptional regulator
VTNETHTSFGLLVKRLRETIAKETEVSFATLLKTHRVATGLTQQKLAERVRAGTTTIANWESGRTPRIGSEDTRINLANTLELTGREREHFLHAARRGTVRMPGTRPALLVLVVPCSVIVVCVLIALQLSATSQSISLRTSKRPDAHQLHLSHKAVIPASIDNEGIMGNVDKANAGRRHTRGADTYTPPRFLQGYVEGGGWHPDPKRLADKYVDWFYYFGSIWKNDSVALAVWRDGQQFTRPFETKNLSKCPADLQSVECVRLVLSYRLPGRQRDSVEYVDMLQFRRCLAETTAHIPIAFIKKLTAQNLSTLARIDRAFLRAARRYSGCQTTRAS